MKKEEHDVMMKRLRRQVKHETRKASEKATEEIVNKLVARFKPESVSVAQADIIGYRFDEETKTLHLLSQKDADILTSKGKEWSKISDNP